MELKDLGLQRIHLDLSNNITENFFAKEGDVGTRGLSIKVLNNSVEIDTTGVSITMYARVGQEVYSVDATVKDALKGEYELIYPTSILKSGIVYAELQLKKLNDIISTKKFKILVESGIVTDSAIEGHDSYPIFEQLLEAGANEITRESNEEIRKLNEIARDDAESLRGVRLDELEVDFTSHKEEIIQQKLDYVEDMNKKANKVQEAWIIPTLLNGWVQLSTLSPPRFHKDGFGRIILDGIVRSGTNNTTIFILPEGYRPNSVVYLSSIAADVFAQIRIMTDGSVIYRGTTNPTWASLIGLFFIPQEV